MKLEDGADIALAAFKQGADKCKTKEDLSRYCQMLCTVSAKTIHGIEGRKFKKAFLGEAIKDNECIEPMLIN